MQRPDKGKRAKSSASHCASSSQKRIGVSASRLVPQPHGGALRHGSQPGNAPGTGRPPSATRAALRRSLNERIPILEGIADGDSFVMRSSTTSLVGSKKHVAECTRLITPSISDRLAAIREMARYGLGETVVEHQDIRTHPDAMRFVMVYREALLLE